MNLNLEFYLQNVIKTIENRFILGLVQKTGEELLDDVFTIVGLNEQIVRGMVTLAQIGEEFGECGEDEDARAALNWIRWVRV